ncbi:Response regulator PleD [Methylobacterium crusticola]|uniref:diguanylate cyclase n=1 Tax=Methylobacterium crusticola TaxID=1697972 RepID=A0ABQ4QX57_9HYPH|nr:diguanylate cyclase [Methylobacterium crusticola]GJD49799.1 Response regulator PleD [Methylobacterium crusticola]
MRVVLVEPGQVLRKAVASLLEEGGHQVRAFGNSLDALACVKEDESVACVITSLEVQPICGLELCWSLRAFAGVARPLAVIAMSSGREGRNLGEVLDSGADDFISKPPGGVELHARLRVAERVLALQRQLIRDADTDHLTQLLSRRGFMTRARACVEALPPQGLLTALMVDIDSFKAINDRHGHETGDKVIRKVADVLKETGALAGRLGGEEFAVLMPGHGLGSAGVVADRLQKRCARLRIPGRRGPVPVTCSIGVSAWSAPDTVESLLKRADGALYAAKAGGRNQVMSVAGEILDRVS